MTHSPWWSTAAIYELYVQSFADSDGDGIGEAADPASMLALYRRALRLRRTGFSPDTPVTSSPGTPVTSSPGTPVTSSPGTSIASSPGSPVTSSPGAPMTWLPAPAGVLAFTRGPLACITNLSPSPVPLPPGDLILTSAPLTPSPLASSGASAPSVPPDSISHLPPTPPPGSASPKPLSTAPAPPVTRVPIADPASSAPNDINATWVRFFWRDGLAAVPRSGLRRAAWYGREGA